MTAACRWLTLNKWTPDHEAAHEIDSKAYEAMKALVKLLSGPPQPKGKHRHQHLQYIPVERDGVIEFVRDPFDVEMSQMFAEVMEELFGPEPAEDVE